MITVRVIYEKLLKRIQDRVLKNEFEKVGVQIKLLQAVSDLTKVQYLEDIVKNQAKKCRPSGADIKDLFQELKNEAYFLHKINGKNKLFIDEEVISKIFGTDD